MRPSKTLCQNGCVRSPLFRALALALAALLALPPAALAAPGDPLPSVRAELAKAAELAKNDRHAEAAESLQKAIALLAAHPSLLDEDSGRLLSDAALQLAVERLMAGDEDGGDAALAQLVRLDPDRELRKADYPPAFLVELASVKKRLFAEPRGDLRILAPPGAGEARVQLDGRTLRSAPVDVADLIPGEHFVRVERAGVAWGQKVIAIAGVTTQVAPLPGADGPAAEVTEPSRHVAVPGAPVAPPPAPAPVVVRPAAEPPSRALVIPRQRTPDDDAPAQPSKTTAPAKTRLVALEPDAVKTVREPPPKANHTVLWIVAGALLAAGLAAGGISLYENGRSPTTATVTTTWGH